MTSTKFRKITMRELDFPSLVNSLKNDKETIVFNKNISSLSTNISFNTVKYADKYVKSTKRRHIRRLIQYRLFYLGNSLKSATVPLINDFNTLTSTFVNFVSSDYSETNGLGDATNITKYVQPNFLDSLWGKLYNQHYVLGTKSQISGATTIQHCGTVNSTGLNNFRALHFNTDANGKTNCQLGSNVTVVTSNVQVSGDILEFSRSSNVSLVSRLNGVSNGSTSSAITAIYNNLQMVFFGRNLNGTIVASDTTTHSLDGFGYALSTSQSLTDYNLIKSFHTKILR